ncbi:universal stress protein [Roseicyclus sp. F158]|uniref:Universal stress protein n=1 Tax=Tropicimonas omnivorans TaxID=3075590 RepID=A0ABU3DFW5_9RHOB|nr:universal stress protein [Roseicyclus sp. F158]MDT0682032.1 universal stress protein [Roseicyclus sp. F158]
MTRHFDCFLTGALRHGRSKLTRKFHGQLPKPVLDQLKAADDEMMARVSTQFMELVREGGVEDRADFVDLVPDRDGPISSYARAFDIVVTGSHPPDTSEEHAVAFPDLIALQSGRPVLVVPPDYEASGLADHALVAWDGKRSSARALGDAMPILEQKACVTILTVGAVKPEGADILLRNLQRHNISARYVTRPREGSVATTILSAAEEFSAKLLVMGAFEHSKFSHDIMGGVTTDVMRDTSIPVLLSH